MDSNGVSTFTVFLFIFIAMILPGLVLWIDEYLWVDEVEKEAKERDKLRMSH